MTHIQVQNRKKVLVMPLKSTLVTQSILRLIFSTYVATRHRLNYTGQESIKNNLRFVILTQPWPWNKVKVIQPGVTW